jgi:hypothetical protein
MQAGQAEEKTLRITPGALATMISALSGRNRGREDDDHPSRPGPWDPVIRQAVERALAFGPLPDPWRSRSYPYPIPWRLALASVLAKHPEVADAISGFLDEVALNPQPLPPRWAFLSSIGRIVAERAELLQEYADAISPGQERGIIIVGGRLSRFVDEWCGNGFRLKWPFPGPRPNWFSLELSGLDLVVIGAQLHQSALESFSPVLQRQLADSGTKFLEAGLSREL